MIEFAVVVAALAGWLWAGPPLAVAQRLPAMPSSNASPSDGRGAAGAGWVERVLPRAAVCVCSGAAVGAGLGGPPAALVGAVLGGLASWLIARLEPPSARRRRETIERDLPMAVDLLAACARAGRPVESSVEVVAAAVGGPLAELLFAHAARTRLGADPITEWRSMREDPQLGPLARSLLRSLESGAPLVDSLERLAADTRLARSAALQRRARSVGVRAAGPLGLCFLPAFMLVGVVPTVVGGFSRLML
jgi:Flp pilus assembly protein TadB